MFQASILKNLLAPVASAGVVRGHRWSSYPSYKNALCLSRVGVWLQNPEVSLDMTPGPLGDDSPVEEVYVNAGVMKSLMATVRSDSIMDIKIQDTPNGNRYLLVDVFTAGTHTMCKSIRCEEPPAVRSLLDIDYQSHGFVRTTSQSFFGLLSRMKPFTANDHMRPTLCGINFHQSAFQMHPIADMGPNRAVASDGHVLAMEDCEEMAGLFADDAPKDFTITPPWKLLSYLKRTAGALVSVKLCVRKKPDVEDDPGRWYMMVSSNPWCLALPLCEDKYPPIYNLFGGDMEIPITLKKDVVDVFAQTSKTVVIEASMGIQTMQTHKPAFMSFGSIDPLDLKTEVTLSTSYPANYEYKVGFGVDVLKKLFRYLEVPVIVLRAVKEEHRIHIACIPKRLCVAMPISLQV